MTVVRHKFLRPSPAGDVPYSLELRFRPSRARVLDGDPKAVVVPAEFTEDLPAGVLNVDLASTGPGWCWEIFRPYGKVESLREWVVVPESVPDPDRPGEFLPVDYPDLVRVDPATLEPTATPDPAWWAALEAAKATAADVEAARVAAAGSALESGSARDGAVVAAGEASGSATEAAGAASAAAGAAGAAHESAATASARAGEAGAARTGAESARDATVAAAGGSEASAALAAEAAVESAQSAADAEAAALDVVTRADSGEFKGDQGLPGNATMRVDTTVGTRVFITDGATERMISGKVSRKLATPDYINGWAVDLIGLGIYLSRIDDLVTLEIPSRGLTGASATSNLWLALPLGFRRPSGIGNYGIFGYLADNSVPVSLSFDRDSLSLTTRGLPNGMIQWRTTDPWPTSLPGIPA